MQVDGVGREVADEDVDDLVDEAAVDAGQRDLLEHELAVDDEREELAEHEQQVEVLGLLGVGRGRGDELDEALRLSRSTATFGTSA